MRPPRTIVGVADVSKVLPVDGRIVKVTRSLTVTKPSTYGLSSVKPTNDKPDEPVLDKVSELTPDGAADESKRLPAKSVMSAVGDSDMRYVAEAAETKSPPDTAIK